MYLQQMILGPFGTIWYQPMCGAAPGVGIDGRLRQWVAHTLTPITRKAVEAAWHWHCSSQSLETTRGRMGGKGSKKETVREEVWGENKLAEEDGWGGITSYNLLDLQVAAMDTGPVVTSATVQILKLKSPSYCFFNILLKRMVSCCLHSIPCSF